MNPRYLHAPSYSCTSGPNPRSRGRKPRRGTPARSRPLRKVRLDEPWRTGWDGSTPGPAPHRPDGPKSTSVYFCRSEGATDVGGRSPAARGGSTFSVAVDRRHAHSPLSCGNRRGWMTTDALPKAGVNGSPVQILSSRRAKPQVTDRRLSSCLPAILGIFSASWWAAWPGSRCSRHPPQPAPGASP